MRLPSPISAARWLLDGTLIVLVVVVFAALVVARLLPAVGHQTVTIIGRSMEPTIPIGSVVVLDPVAPDDVGVGEVVTVTIPERLITYTHRVVERIDRTDGRWLRTKGDNNAGDDPALARAEWVTGRVDATLPAIGYLLELLSMPSGMLSVLGVSLTLFLSARLLEDLEWTGERRPVLVAASPTGFRVQVVTAVSMATPARLRGGAWPADEAGPAGSRRLVAPRTAASLWVAPPPPFRTGEPPHAASRAAIRARMVARATPRPMPVRT